MPVVSIVMPVRNAARWLERAVESVLEQTYRDFEFLIIDDGSTDESPAILRRYAARDPRIRLICREWRGISPTRQELLALSTGRYYAMSDADDESEPQRLEKQVAYLESHPECVCVTCGMLLIDPDGYPIRTVNAEQTHEEIDAAMLSGAPFFTAGAYVVRHDALLAAGGIRNVTLAYDLDMFLRLAERGRLAGLPEVLYRYRQHVSNSTGRWEELNRSIARTIEEARVRRGLPPEVARDRLLPGRPETAVGRHCKWAWWALAAGNLRTARRHALAALRLRPFSTDSWRVLACAVRGH